MKTPSESCRPYLTERYGDRSTWGGSGGRLLNKCAFVMLLCALPSCAIVHETHYLEKPVEGRDSNVFRVRVRGYALFSAARYVAGNYDSKAVDLYFNELSSTQPEGTLIRPFVPAETPEGEAPRSADRNSSPADSKTFVMLLSTNVKAVTNAIGQFAENQIAADALSNLLQRDDVRQIEERSSTIDLELSRRQAVADEIEALMNYSAPPTSAELTAKYLRVLNAIASAQGSAQIYKTIDEARVWFAAQSN